jgi:uncharacterized membrane protein YgcG
MVPAATLGTPAAQQGGNFMVSVAGTAVDSLPHLIDLKITQLPGGQLSEVTGFVVGPEDVVQVKQGENLIVSTSPDLTTHQVTVRNIQGIPIDLVPLPSNAWSLQGLLPGLYTLNVNAAMSTSGIIGIYETILVILEPDQQPLPPTTIINQITIRPPDRGCPGNMTLINGTCQLLPSPKPGPGDNKTKPGPGENDTLVCPAMITYGTGPCDIYIPPENGQCPEGHRFVDENTGCVPEGFLNPPTPPTIPPIECPEGQTGIPPNCQPLNCNVENPPPECGEQPIVCPDGSTVSPGNECPEPPPENGEEEGPENGPPEGGDVGNNGAGGGSSGGDGGDESGGGGNGGAGTVDVPSLFG